MISGRSQKSIDKFRTNLLSLTSVCCALFYSLTGCRVQAGNPQADKPKNPGTVTVALADAPVDELSSLFVTVKGIAFAAEGSGRCLREPNRACADSSLVSFDFDRSVEVDLLSLSDGRTEVLPFAQELPSGAYEGLRLFLVEGSSVRGVLKSDASSVEVEFAMSPFGRREFTIAQEFDVQEGAENQLIVHVDLRRSLRKNDRGGFVLMPVVNVVPERFAARLYGAVSDSNVTRICAYNEAGKRRPEGSKFPGMPSGNSPVSSQQPPRPQFPLPPAPQPTRTPFAQPPVSPVPPLRQPDATSSCDNAEAVADLSDSKRSYDLRYLPPVRYTLRAFKKDGSYTDTSVSNPLLPRESRELDL
ncbi:MAG: hypothetical protein RI932_1321 [Pseudomonadota bacterium]|jgi:hypothetical protein